MILLNAFSYLLWILFEIKSQSDRFFKHYLSLLSDIMIQFKINKKDAVLCLWVISTKGTWLK
jgi:hypothetical protein